MNIHITITTDDDQVEGDELHALLAEALERIDQARADEGKPKRLTERLGTIAAEIDQAELSRVRRYLADEQQTSRTLRWELSDVRAERDALQRACDDLTQALNEATDRNEDRA